MKTGSPLLFPDADWWLSQTRCCLLQTNHWISGNGLLAQADGGVPQDGKSLPAGGGIADLLVQFFSSPINLILISAILFMFIVARPQQKQLKQHQKALSGLKKNDRVITSGGIHGVVVQTNLDETLVTIRIDENSGARMTINRDAVTKIIASDAKSDSKE